MIVYDFNIICIAINEPEADAPLIIDGYGVLAFPGTLQFMESVARWNPQVVKACCDIKILQPSHCTYDDVRRKPSRLAGKIQLLRVLVDERLDHG